MRDELDWPVEDYPFEDLTFEWEPEELGIDWKTAAKIDEIKQLRPLTTGQPWGIFFVKFEPKRLPIVALRRILGRLVLKQRSSANNSEIASWKLDDLLFISAYGEGDDRRISLAHFTEADHMGNLPSLRVLGFSEGDRDLKIDYVQREMQTKLRWPHDMSQVDRWRKDWRSAFMLKHREVITTSKQLALTLAELARDIRGRVNGILEIESADGPLRKLMAAFREALIHDLTDDGFADMYAQTIAYGLLSASMARASGALVADDLVQMVPVTNPFLKELMETFLDVGGKKRRQNKHAAQASESGSKHAAQASESAQHLDFDELGINEIVELLREVRMEAVLLDFDTRNPQEDPVIHFYELFLKEYDAKKRMQRGVFYTPKPVVSYIVRSVHELLQTEFGLHHGLADTTSWAEFIERHTSTPRQQVSCSDTSTPRKQVSPAQPANPDTLAGASCLYSDAAPPLKIPDGTSPDQPFVQILDPATGTATFLVEVIDVIHRHLKSKWDEGGADVVPKISNLKSPLSDFTTYWNHYVPQCLLPRLHGYELMMAPYAIAHMKTGLKLAETKYRFGSDERVRVYLTNALEPWAKQLRLPDIEALAHESQAVNDIKRRQRFTVVIGNPPYSKSMSKHSWSMRLVDDFKIGLNEKKSDLTREEWKFLRFAYFNIENARVGLVGFVINNAFLTAPTHRGVRRFLMDRTYRLRIVDLHGDSRKGEVAPDGSSDENVFDIQQGVCILLAENCEDSPDLKKNGLHKANIFGSRTRKYDELIRESTALTAFHSVTPHPPLLLFAESKGVDDSFYRQCVSVRDIFCNSNTGIQTKNDALFTDISSQTLQERMKDVLGNIGGKRAKCVSAMGSRILPVGEFLNWLGLLSASAPFSDSFTSRLITDLSTTIKRRLGEHGIPRCDTCSNGISASWQPAKSRGFLSATRLFHDGRLRKRLVPMTAQLNYSRFFYSRMKVSSAAIKWMSRLTLLLHHYLLISLHSSSV